MGGRPGRAAEQEQAAAERDADHRGADGRRAGRRPALVERVDDGGYGDGVSVAQFGAVAPLESVHIVRPFGLPRTPGEIDGSAST